MPAIPKGPQAIAVIIDVFLDAVMNSSREDLQAKAIDYLLGYLEKIISEWNARARRPSCLCLKACFQRLSSLPEKLFFFLASSHIPLKRIGQSCSARLPAGSGLSEFNELLIHSLRAAYGYWLTGRHRLGLPGVGFRPGVSSRIS